MLKENEFLRLVADLARLSIKFKDERILPGTAWIDEMPIDITIKGASLVLNSVGEFGGDSGKYSKSSNRGKGKFRRLVPHIHTVLTDNALELRIYLTPLSPVWKSHYTLREAEVPLKTSHGWFLDLTVHPE